MSEQPDTRPAVDQQPTAARKVGESLRERLREIAPDKAELVVTALTEALQARKAAWGNCPTCAKSVKVEIQDSTAAVNAFKALLEATEGRPGVAGEAGPTVVVHRITTASGRDGSPSMRDEPGSYPLGRDEIERNLSFLLTGPTGELGEDYLAWARAWLENPEPCPDRDEDERERKQRLHEYAERRKRELASGDVSKAFPEPGNHNAAQNTRVTENPPFPAGSQWSVPGSNR